MGTLTLRRFARKVRAFETALTHDVFYKHFKRDDFEVFVLTQSERRLEALRWAADPVIHSDRSDDYHFATFEALDPDEFPEWEWCDLDGEPCYGVLYGEESNDDAQAAGGRTRYGVDQRISPNRGSISAPPRPHCMGVAGGVRDLLRLMEPRDSEGVCPPLPLGSRQLRGQSPDYGGDAAGRPSRRRDRRSTGQLRPSGFQYHEWLSVPEVVASRPRSHAG
jgi:hypothetical protein